MMKPAASALAIVLLCLALSAHAQQRTYHADKYGAKEHSKGHYETDSSGRTVDVDRYGSRDHSRGYYRTGKDGVTVRVDQYGQKRWIDGSYITEKPKAKSK